MILKDRRGTELKIGQKVAYNYSGEVDVGYIVDIKEIIRRYKYSLPTVSGYAISVKHYLKDRTSKIRSPHNLVVIFEDKS